MNLGARAPTPAETKALKAKGKRGRDKDDDAAPNNKKKRKKARKADGDEEMAAPQKKKKKKKKKKTAAAPKEKSPLPTVPLTHFCKQAISQFDPKKFPGVDRAKLINRLHSKVWHKTRTIALQSGVADDVAKARGARDAKQVVEEFKKLLVPKLAKLEPEMLDKPWGFQKMMPYALLRSFSASRGMS